MYEALLKATPEYQRDSLPAWLHRARQPCLACPRRAAPCCTPPCKKTWAGCSAS